MGPTGATGATGATGPAGTISDYGVIFSELGNNQTVAYGNNVSFQENEITGDNINHAKNSTDIELDGSKSYFVKYTVSYSIDESSCGSYMDSRNIIFGLTNVNNELVPGSRHIASISRDVNNNSISLGLIISPENDYIVRLTNLTQDLKSVIVNAATITIVRLA